MKPPHLTSLARNIYYDGWGTPQWIIDIALEAIGEKAFALDMAASKENAKAKRFFSAKKRCTEVRMKLLQSQMPYQPVWCNPPGPWRNIPARLDQPPRKGLGSHMWDLFNQYVRCGAFLFFNADHLRYITPTKKDHIAILRKRVRYNGAKHACSFASALLVRYTPSLTARILPQHDTCLWLQP
jgi:hypothetical protein